MMMTRFEKAFVNRRSKRMQNIQIIRESLDFVGREQVRDVLELGCGAGYVTAFLADTLGYNACGADSDPQQIALAREANIGSARSTFNVEDATCLTYGNASFDVVIAQDVFHHTSPWRQVTSEIQRVLRDDGYAIWYDFEFPPWLRWLLAPAKSLYGLYSLEEVRSCFDSHGFEEQFHEVKPMGPFGHHLLLSRKMK